MKRITFFVLSVYLFLFLGCFFSGQRLLEVQIELNGDLALETSFGVSDSLGKAGAFSRLEGKSLQETSFWKTPPGNPTLVELKGAIRIRLIHVATPFATVETTQLQVVVDPKAKGNWLIPPGEIKRLETMVK